MHLKIFEFHYVSIESGVAATAEQIAEVAAGLEMELSEQYHAFLATFGTLDIGAIEFVGISEHISYDFATS